jgi:hypothetical protein
MLGEAPCETETKTDAPTSRLFFNAFREHLEEILSGMGVTTAIRGSLVVG